MKFYCYLFCFLFSCQSKNGDYVCPPCDLPCDELSFSGPGLCPHCNMELVSIVEVKKFEELKVGEIDLKTGSGAFLISGGQGHENNTITVHYHMPNSFKPSSEMLLVVPGAGRDGDEYRDAWIEASEKYGVLILSPTYPDSSYGFGGYHMGGLMEELNLSASVEYVENSNIAKLDEEKLTFTVNANSSQWIFKDFDRIFDLVVESLSSEQREYDIFGHSAGGQILHRLTLFYPQTKAKRIVASNSGFYTLPDMESKLPFGMKGTGKKAEDLKTSFKKRMTLFTGEFDNEKETGGTLLRSVSADQQGLHRLERSQYFYKVSKKKAEELGYEFNWKYEIVPGVGHDFRKMTVAAAEYLYGRNKGK